MGARHASLAEHYRWHREVFLLAMELGCLPCEAAAELERRKAQARWAEDFGRLQAKMMAPPLHRATDSRFSNWNSPWMMRN